MTSGYQSALVEIVGCNLLIVTLFIWIIVPKLLCLFSDHFLLSQLLFQNVFGNVTDYKSDDNGKNYLDYECNPG